MKIPKKVKCNHCQAIVEETGTCTCNSIVLAEGNVVKGTIGVDYTDVSAKLLQE